MAAETARSIGMADKIFIGVPLDIHAGKDIFIIRLLDAADRLFQQKGFLLENIWIIFLIPFP